MNEFIKQLKEEEISMIEKSFPIIDSFLTTLKSELGITDEDIRYDQARKTFVVLVKEEQQMFGIITYAGGVSMEIRIVDNEAQTEEVAAVLVYNTRTNEFVETKYFSKLKEAYESAFITDLFWKLTEFTRTNEAPKEEPTAEVLQPDEIK